MKDRCFLFSASAGTHTLAVEVHQGGTTTSDGLFGAEIRAVTLPPDISISRDDGGNNVIRFTADSNWQMMRSTTVQGGYAPVAGNPLGSNPDRAGGATGRRVLLPSVSG